MIPEDCFDMGARPGVESSLLTFCWQYKLAEWPLNTAVHTPEPNLSRTNPEIRISHSYERARLQFSHILLRKVSAHFQMGMDSSELSEYGS